MSKTSVIEEFLVRFAFKSDTKGAEKAKSTLSSLTKAAGAFVAAVVGSKAFAGAARAVSSVATRFSELNTESKALNTSAESILELGHAATLSNSSTGALKSSLSSLNKMAIEAANGIGAGAEAFWRMGIRARDQNGKLKESSALLEEIGERVRGMSRERGLAVLSRFGIDTSLYDMLTSGTAELRQEMRELYKSAGIDATKATKASSEFASSMHRLKSVLGATKDAAILKLMPQIQSSVDRARKFILKHMPSISLAIERVGNFTIRVLEAGAGSIGRFYRQGKNLVGFFKALHASTGGASTAVIAIIGGLLLLKKAMSPLMLVLSLLAGIALLVDDYLTFREGGKAFVDWGGKAGTVLKTLAVGIGLVTAGVIALKVAVTALNIVLWLNPVALKLLAIVAILALIAAATYLVYSNWEPIKEFFGKLWKHIWDDFTGGFKDAANRILDIIESIKKAFLALGGVFSNLFKGDFEGAKKSAGELAGEVGNIKDNVSNLAVKALKTGVSLAVPGAGALFRAAETIPTAWRAMEARGAVGEQMTPWDGHIPIGGMSHAPVTQNIEQRTEITVTGSASPEATGRSVASQQKNVNAEAARNLRPRVT